MGGYKSVTAINRNAPALEVTIVIKGRDFGLFESFLARNRRFRTSLLQNCRVYMSAELTPEDVDRIIGMAWEDRTPFEAIEVQFGLKENDVRQIMRRELKRGSFERWRERVKGRATKHRARRGFDTGRFRCSEQRNN
jgi:uncharacterized protein (TIGR03643 family)